MKKTLQNKIALITGGSRGIGAAIAKRLAQEGAGVAISYSSSPEKADELVKEIENMGRKAFAFKADHAHSHEIESLIKEVVKVFGQIDILVHNAGIFVGRKIDDPDWNATDMSRQMMVNLTSIVYATRAAIPHIPNGGKIILIGSINGEKSAFQGCADYSATKAAMVGYKNGWARDLGPKNITVNLIQPGPIDTDMNPADSDFAKEVVKDVPLGRYGKSDEIAGAVAFLAGPDASYISGATLTVDGGYLT